MIHQQAPADAGACWCMVRKNGKNQNYAVS